MNIGLRSEDGPLRRLAGYSVDLLLVGLAAAGIVAVSLRMQALLLPLLIALMLATLLRPLRTFLNRYLPTALATGLTFLALVAVVAAVGALFVPPFAEQAGDLGPTLSQAQDRIENWLVDGPLGLERADVEDLRDDLQSAIADNRDGVVSGVVAGSSFVLQLIGGTFLAIVLSTYLVSDAAAMGRGLVDLLPKRDREKGTAAVLAAWRALGAYVRGSIVVGLIDAFFIGLGLSLLGVPLVVPLVVLTFFGAFFPVIGAVAAGAVATLVALVDGGGGTALAVGALAVFVQQLEGNVIAPRVLGKAVRMHPAVIIGALSVGSTLAGVVGAFAAVPATGMTLAAVRAWIAVGSGTPGLAAPSVVESGPAIADETD